MNDLHETPTQDDASLAALYVAGAMDHDERLAFERRLETGDEDALDALRSFDELIVAQAEIIPAVQPKPQTKAAILKRLRATSAEQAEDPPFIQREDQTAWAEIGLPGVVKRTVHRDARASRETFLLRLDPGARIPAHPHHGVEDCYIVQGDLHSFETVFNAGDYFRADAGTQHGESWTQNGCLLLITASIDEHAA